MYEKNTYKHASKCMKETGIQMYEKNRHTNVWKKTGIPTYEKIQAYKCMKKIYLYTGAMGSQLQRPGSMGVQCLSQGNLSRDKDVNCHPSGCQPTNPFFEWWVGIERPTLWLLDNHTHHWATAAQNTNIQMYEKNTHINTHTNIWKKHAYKWMTKTRIQNRIQMYDKNPHANVWQKHAYKHA